MANNPQGKQPERRDRPSQPDRPGSRPGPQVDQMPPDKSEQDKNKDDQQRGGRTPDRV